MPWGCVFFFLEMTKYRARLALLLSPIAVAATMACDPAIGKDSSPDLLPQNSSSLANRALISVAFMHPVGLVITTKYRQPLMDHLTANAPYLFRALFSTESERTVGMLQQRLATVAHVGGGELSRGEHAIRRGALGETTEPRR